MGFGGSTLILIFGVLCLITFSVLALVSARSDYHLMEKTVNAVFDYYRADGEGEEFLAQVDRELNRLRAEAADENEFYQKAAKAFPEYYDADKRTVSAAINMNERLHLEVVLLVSYGDQNARQYQIESYKTVQNGVVEIDTALPVWHE